MRKRPRTRNRFASLRERGLRERGRDFDEEERVVGSALAAVLLASGLASAAQADSTFTPLSSNCQLVAQRPYNGGSGLVMGRMGRTGCASAVSVTMRLKHERPVVADDVLAKTTMSLRNSTTTLSGNRTSGHRYYTETTGANGGKSQSERWTAP